MYPVNYRKREGYKSYLMLTGIFIVFLFNWKWALILTIGYATYLVALGLLAWWIDSRTEAGQDDFL